MKVQLLNKDYNQKANIVFIQLDVSIGFVPFNNLF